jgi:hypothetical protein
LQRRRIVKEALAASASQARVALGLISTAGLRLA